MKAKMEFKVGDKVTIRENLTRGSVYGGVQFNSEMESLCGRKAMIVTKHLYDIIDDCCYSINIDGGLWTWSAAMFEPQKKKFNSLEVD